MVTRRHIPNLLTWARVVAVPASLAIMLIHPAWETSALLWIFVAASLTDYLDGILARKWNVVSPIGTMLDPIADKLLVALMLVYLLTVMGTELFLPVTVMLLRELYISGLREFLAAKNIPLPVSRAGKWKTALQMAAITLLLAQLAIDPPGQINFPCKLVSKASELTTSCVEQPWLLNAVRDAGMPMLYAAAALAFLSAVAYTRASLRHLR